MLVHATYFHPAIERVRFFKIGLLYTEQEKCSYKPYLLKEKIHDLMQAFPLDTSLLHSRF